jgi:lysyl-tRNA synthetase, class II
MFNESMINKLDFLRKSGVDPYPPRTKMNTTPSTMVKREFDKLKEAGDDVTVHGRVMAVRGHGKARFVVIRDEAGEIQLYCRIDVMGEDSYETVKKGLDVGDFIVATGSVFKTRTEEITVEVQRLNWAAKALVPLPEKFHGLTDPEIRYRKRQMDMISDPTILSRLRVRNRILQVIRNILWDKGFEEVETPILQPLYGGALAKPFETHHNALDMPAYLRIAPELYLKRLVVGGMTKIFEMGKCFRNEGISPLHNPEFTMLELYEAWTCYRGMMKISEELVSTTVKEITGGFIIEYEGNQIDFTPPWTQITMADAFKQYAGLDIEQLRDDKFALSYMKENGIQMEKAKNFKGFCDEVFKKKVVPNLIQPTIVYDYPIEMSPLAKLIPGDDRYVERFQFIISGFEMGNAFSELNDPQDQLKRFESQLDLKKSGDDESHEIDNDYVEALGVGMPPTGGLGIGIDRLVMVLTGQTTIREVLAFPQLRKKDANK